MTENRAAAAPSTPPADQPARDRIRLDLDRTFLVEAGPGSGKTWSLVERMVALIANGRTPIQTMAAVTFTRKAAAELRGRFQVALERSLRSEDSVWGEGERARLADALQNLERGFIGTIHSFSAKLLRERPVEIGLDPAFEEMDDLDDSVFREACWQDFLMKVRVDNEKVLDDLEAVGLGPADLRDSFSALSLYPEVRPAPGSSTPPDFSVIRSKLDRFLQSAAAGLPDHRPEKGYDDLQRLLFRMLLRRRNLGLADHKELMETLGLFEIKPDVVKKRWRSKEEAEAHLSDFEDFKENVAAPALRDWREYRHSKVLAFLELATDLYAEKRKGRSRLNFQDQLLNAAHLLRDNPEVRGYFRKRFLRILVDEFQDTDPIQAEVLFYLTGENMEERDWTKIDPTPGSLFLVGDPKQSIYRFRRADIDVYNLVKKRVRESGGKILELTSNFRSLDCVADWVNSVFQIKFPAREDIYQARFARLNPERQACWNAGSGVFKMNIPKVERNREKEIAERDAAAIARLISMAVSGRLAISKKEAGDFLILFRFKKNMGVYARELERSGIPFEISGSEAFSESAEIREIINLLQALQNPHNPVMTVAVLRGLFFGVSDEELLDFKSEGDLLSFPESGGGDVSPGGKVRRALRVMNGWWELSKTLPPSIVIESILESSGLLYYLVSAEMGSSRAGNVLKLVEALRAKEREGVTSFAAAADFLGEWVDARALEEMSLTPNRTNAVRLMNLHKAKGLESPIVILANPVGIRAKAPEKHIVRTDTREVKDQRDIRPPGPTGFFRFTKRIGWRESPVSQPVDWEKMAAAEMKYEKAEEDRLMYVAATRARDLLIISTYEGDLGSRKAWGALDDRLDEVGEFEAPETEILRVEPGRPGDHPGGREILFLKKDELSNAKAGIVSRKGEASRAGYLMESVTSLARSEEGSRDWISGGLGMSWGTAVHSVLSTIGKTGLEEQGEMRGGSDLETRLVLLSANALAAVGRDRGEAAALSALVRSIIESDFWLRARSADNAFFEIPFSVSVESSEPEYRELAGRLDLVPTVRGKPVATLNDAPLILSGSIDLAFREKNGWVIADYKTDAIPGSADESERGPFENALDALVKYYTPQVNLYSRFWARISGEKVKESGLYFTSPGIWKRIG